MTSDLYVKLNSGFPWKKQHSTTGRLFLPSNLTAAFRKVDQKYVENLETWCWNRTEENTLQTIKRRNADCIGHILRRNCLLKHVVKKKRYEELKEDEEVDVSSYWKISRKRENIGN